MKIPVLCMFLECRKFLGEVECSLDGVSDGLCLDCAKKLSPGAYHVSRIRIIEDGIADHDSVEQGIDEINQFLYRSRAA